MEVPSTAAGRKLEAIRGGRLAVPSVEMYLKGLNERHHGWRGENRMGEWVKTVFRYISRDKRVG